LTLRTADGVSLAAYEAGTGDRGVVLVNERGALDPCGWWDYAPTLVKQGFRVLMFNHRCTTGSDCPADDAGGDTDASGLMTDIEAATDRLKSDGVTHIALLGGSQGAAESLIFGARSHPGVDAVVSLSADELTDSLAAAPYPATAAATAKQVRLPALVVVADQDPYVSASDTRALPGLNRSSIPGSAKRLDVVSGSTHGWLLLEPTPSGAPSSTSAAVLAFLAKYVD
jgi:dienelactone hydrolase